MIRKLITGAALAVSLVAPLAGCGGESSDGAGGSPSPSPTPPPAEVLAAAVTRTTGVAVKARMVDVGGGNTELGSGGYDAASKSATLTVTPDGTAMQMVITQDKLYLSGLAELEGKTLRAQIAKIPNTSYLAAFADPAYPLALLPAAGDVLMTSPGSFSGTVDLAKVQAQAVGTKKFVEAATTAAGAKANAVTFQAVVDDQGYLSKVTFTFPGWGDEQKDAQIEMTYSAFGEAVTVTEPTGAKVIEASAEFYTNIA